MSVIVVMSRNKYIKDIMNGEEDLRVTIGRWTEDELKECTDEELFKRSTMIRVWKEAQNQNA
jgi:hypothetical protein